MRSNLLVLLLAFGYSALGKSIGLQYVPVPEDSTHSLFGYLGLSNDGLPTVENAEAERKMNLFFAESICSARRLLLSNSYIQSMCDQFYHKHDSRSSYDRIVGDVELPSWMVHKRSETKGVAGQARTIRDKQYNPWAGKKRSNEKFNPWAGKKRDDESRTDRASTIKALRLTKRGMTDTGKAATIKALRLTKRGLLDVSDFEDERDEKGGPPIFIMG